MISHNDTLMKLVRIMAMVLMLPTVSASVLHPYDCDGIATDTFDEGDSLCVYGTGFEADSVVDIYVVEDKDAYNSGDGLTGEKTTASITSQGILALKKIWESVKKGFYDIVADINQNGLYDEGDSVNIAQGAGVTVNGEEEKVHDEVPEFSTVTAFLVLLGANLYIFKKRRKA